MQFFRKGFNATNYHNDNEQYILVTLSFSIYIRFYHSIWDSKIHHPLEAIALFYHSSIQKQTVSTW